MRDVERRGNRNKVLLGISTPHTHIHIRPRWSGKTAHQYLGKSKYEDTPDWVVVVSSGYDNDDGFLIGFISGLGIGEDHQLRQPKDSIENTNTFTHSELLRDRESLGDI